MRIIVNNKEYSLGEPILFGGEGDIYTLNYDGSIKCVKVYYYEKRTSFNERKILTLISKFHRFNLSGIEDHIAYPELPIYDASTGKFCGFIMKYFDNHINLTDLKFSNNTLTYGETNYIDTDILKIVDNLFFYLMIFHKLGIVLGDLNPENILVDKGTLLPAFVDVDSVQVGSFYSNTKRSDYIDPTVKIDGFGKSKYFIYSIDSDIFSLALITYELILGAKPHFYQTVTPTETNYKKSIDLSLLDFYLSNTEKITKHNHVIRENELYKAVKARLEYLKENHSYIFFYFKSIFTERKRYYFHYLQKRIVNIQRKNGETNVTEVELITQSKADPEELTLFMEQFKLIVP